MLYDVCKTLSRCMLHVAYVCAPPRSHLDSPLAHPGLCVLLRCIDVIFVVIIIIVHVYHSSLLFYYNFEAMPQVARSTLDLIGIHMGIANAKGYKSGALLVQKMLNIIKDACIFSFMSFHVMLVDVMLADVMTCQEHNDAKETLAAGGSSSSIGQEPFSCYF